MIYAALILVALFVAGCATWPVDQSDFLHVNSRAEAEKIARDWAISGTGREWSTVAFTGSMKPILNGGEIMLVEKYVGQPLRVGQMVVFYRDEGAPRCVHQVVDLTAGAAYLSGVNNKHSDGWFSLSSVKFVVARVLTFPR